MNLFFDAVSSSWYIALFSDQREIISSSKFQILWNESSKATDLIDTFMKDNNISYDRLKNIVVVAGPGSFTWIRTISLIVNTLAYIYPNISLTAINYFDMFDSYPVVKTSSKRDLFVKYEKNAKISIESNSDFIWSLQWWVMYGDAPLLDIPEAQRDTSDIDYKWFISDVTLDQLKRVAPLYIKKPNIS